MKLLILADDFTGALDTGVQLSKNSIRTVVLSNPDVSPAADSSYDVLVINTNIRHASADDAYTCICTLLEKHKHNFSHIYLKTDSALRGNISATLAAAMKTIQKPLCFIPAFPELGRTTSNATAYINGQLLEDSVFNKDPRTPTYESSIPSIINRTHSVRYECISEEKLIDFTKSSPRSDTVYIFDCASTQQMEKIGQAVNDMDLYSFTAGCAGFAATFSSHLAFPTNPFSAPSGNESVLFISGSANAVTLKQLEYAGENNYPVISLSEDIFSSINCTTTELKDKVVYKDLSFMKNLEKAVKTIKSKQSVILATATKSAELFSDETMKNIKVLLKPDEYLHNYIAQYTSCLVKSILEQVDVQNIVVFGGDMVAAILEQLGCYQVEALGEITTGVPLCKIEINGKTCYLATKSGGFGEADVIPVIEQYFKAPII